MPVGEQNTYGLPDGEAIRAAMVAIFRDQRSAVLDWMDTMGYKAFGLPASWPSWDSLKLGASDVAARVRGPIADIWETFLDVSDPVIAAKVDAQSMTLATSVNQTTTGLFDGLLAKITDLFNRGKTTLAEAITKLRGGIADEIKPIEPWRARGIAITEASRAYHEAMIVEAFKSGDVVGWRWKTAEGACPLCLMIEEAAPVVQLDQPFALVGTGEYSIIDSPPAHVNCRCTMEEVLRSDVEPDWSETLVDPVPPKPDISPGDAVLLAEAEAQAGVSFVPPPSAAGGDYMTVMVDVSKVEAAFQRESTYIGPGGTGGIGGRYENFQAFLDRARADGTPIEQPRAGLAADGTITLGDGRHRFAVFRDRGQSLIPLTVPRGDAAKIRRRYGP